MRPFGDHLARAGVTEREAEVLAAVAERLRNREIAERLHISVRTAESHVAALIRKLAAADRAELAEIGVELRRDTSLPMALTSLVGRQHETSELTALVDGHRLVTLIGPAGVGKTRLAVRVAAGLGARFADLAPVGSELVADTLARALGVIPRPGWPLRDALREAAGGMGGLLLVDNCEHVIADVADVVDDLLTAGSELRVLATSREPLGVPGETVFQVPPLPVPPPEGDPTIEEYDAVRLFVDRAAAAAPGFALTDATVGAIVALCRRLDGLPLAIELAASRVRSFDPAELVAHLDRRFELLTGGARTAQPRQRTLRGAIDWSYHLLDDDERTVFARLGVFPADFDFEAAQAVCGIDPGVMAVLPRLVDKSLVSVAGRGTRRYRLLETIRAYAWEQLAASGAEATVRYRHAVHYLELAEHAADGLRTSDQRAWLDRLTVEQANLRAALTYHVGAGGVDDAWRWIAAMRRYWEITGQRHEAADGIERTLALGDPPANPVTVAGLAAASAIVQPADSRAALDLAQRAECLAADLDDLPRAWAARAVGMGAIWVRPELVLPALHEALARLGDGHPWERAMTMQCLVQATGELADALRWGRASVALFRGVDDHMYAANTLFIMAQRAIYAGIADNEVHGWLVESQVLADAAGSEEDQVHATVGFGQLAWLRGDHAGAARQMEECLPTLRRRGDERCTGRALCLLGQRAYEQGSLDEAEELLRGSIAAIVLAGQHFVLVTALETLAAVTFARGRPRQAATLLGTATATRETASARLRPLPQPPEDLRRSLVHLLGAATFETAHAEGRTLTPTQAIAADLGPARGQSERNEHGEDAT